jgi:hypothetical protein
MLKLIIFFYALFQPCWNWLYWPRPFSAMLKLTLLTTPPFQSCWNWLFWPCPFPVMLKLTFDHAPFQPCWNWIYRLRPFPEFRPLPRPALATDLVLQKNIWSYVSRLFFFFRMHWLKIWVFLVLVVALLYLRIRCRIAIRKTNLAVGIEDTGFFSVHGFFFLMWAWPEDVQQNRPWHNWQRVGRGISR